MISTDARRPAAHNGDPVAEQDGLLDVVGDEDDGDLVLLPHPQQELVHAEPRDGVERAERFVHQQQRGRVIDGPGKAARCRMPPESS